MSETVAREPWPERVARLGEALRARGLSATLREEIDASAALGLVDRDDAAEVRTAFHIAFKVRPRDREVFDRAFDAFWTGRRDPRGAPPSPQTRPAAPGDRPRRRQPTVLRWDPDARKMREEADPPGPGDPRGYSPEVLLRRRSFDDVRLSGREIAAIERMIVRLARRFAARRSRRLVPTHGHGKPDLRRSMLGALRTSGELLTLARRTRAQDDARLTFLCDTSGSMDAHTRFLLLFVLAVRRALPRAEVFVFNTELTRVTPSLGRFARMARGDLRGAVEELCADVPDWSGGTQIGESLAAFARDHRGAGKGREGIVVVVSDGLDRGDPKAFAEAVRAVRAKARKLVWLTPLAADPAYQPLTRGMQAAMAHVDVFAPAHDVDSLERALSHLARQP